MIIAAVAVFMIAVLLTRSQWDGDVTEGAALPLAEQAGVAESQILPWKVEGDLLLFVFLAGGATAGFAAGYYWRSLFSGKGNGNGNGTGAGNRSAAGSGNAAGGGTGARSGSPEQ